MKARDLEFDPMDYYDLELKKQIADNATSYFDELVKRSKVSEVENELLSKEYELLSKKQEEDSSKHETHKILSIVLIVLAVIAIIVMIVAIIFLVSSDGANIAALVLTIICPIIAVASIVSVVLYFQKKSKHYAALMEHNSAKLAQLKMKLNEQVIPLWDLFDSDDFVKVVKRTTSIFSLDPYVKPEKLAMLRELYGLKDEPTNSESIVEVMSGDIATNPYIHVRLYTEREVPKAYVGTLPIVWTEWVRDNNGGHMVTRTEILTATVTHPAPEYSDGSYVIYGNEAAPDLSFSRQPSGVDPYMTEKQMRKFEIKTENELASRARDSIKHGGGFTPLANSKFEGLFGAYDRNNEVQFRLLFTPLAQQNMCELIMRKEPYRDDFSFYKMKKINIISSVHGRETTPYDEREMYKFVRIKSMRSHFVKKITECFNSLFFEMAPLLSIPLYQQTDAGTFDVEKHYQNVSDYDAEAIANHMDPSLFMPDGAGTPQILKVTYLRSVGNTDIYQVSSSAFQTFPETDFVPVMGGDGHIHDVPVKWTRYVPVGKTTDIGVREFAGDKFQFNAFTDDEEFKKLDNVYDTCSRNYNFIGFCAPTDYNNLEEEDEKLTSLMNKYLNINRKVD